MPKLINNKGAYGYHEFDCVINGKIKMTQAQLDSAVKKLMRSTRWITNGRYYAQGARKLLQSDLKRIVIDSHGRKIINARVDATRAIAEMYGLKNYKRENYVIEICQK